MKNGIALVFNLILEKKGEKKREGRRKRRKPDARKKGDWGSKIPSSGNLKATAPFKGK